MDKWKDKKVNFLDEYRRSNKCTIKFNKFKYLQHKLSSLTEDPTEKYYNDLLSKLNASNISPKDYWSKNLFGQ